MEGRLVPAHYDAISPFWKNIITNLCAIQFNHRLTATLTTLNGLFILWIAMRADVPINIRRRAIILGWLTLMQFGLGVMTLLLVVPIWAGTLHQTFAAIVLGQAVITLHALRHIVSRTREKLSVQV